MFHCTGFVCLQELSKITMPVIFNEPLSFLQRITEYMEYATLLKTAACTDDPLLRMQVSNEIFYKKFSPGRDFP
jgi:hypothetical protein